MNANICELVPEKIFIYNKSTIRVFYNQFEIWRNDVKIADFSYNRNKDLMAQVRYVMDM